MGDSASAIIAKFIPYRKKAKVIMVCQDDKYQFNTTCYKKAENVVPVYRMRI